MIYLGNIVDERIDNQEMTKMVGLSVDLGFGLRPKNLVADQIKVTYV